MIHKCPSFRGCKIFESLAGLILGKMTSGVVQQRGPRSSLVIDWFVSGESKATVLQGPVSA
jgi:hypothetical protein